MDDSLKSDQKKMREDVKDEPIEALAEETYRDKEQQAEPLEAGYPDDIHIKFTRVLAESFPGLAVLLVAALLIGGYGLYSALFQPYKHHNEAPGPSSMAYWVERQPLDQGDLGFLKRPDFYVRPVQELHSSNGLLKEAVITSVALGLPEQGTGVVLFSIDRGPVQSESVQSGPVQGNAFSEISLDQETNTTAIAIARNGLALVANDKGAIILQDVSGYSLGDQVLHEGAVRDIDVAESANLVISVGDDGNAIVSKVSAKGGISPVSRILIGVPLHTVAITPSGDWGIAGGREGKIWVLPLTTPEPSPISFSGHQGTVTAVAISDDGATIVSGVNNGNVLIRARNGDEFASFNAAFAGISDLEIAADGATVMTAGHDGRLRIWTREGKEVGSGQTVANSLAEISASPDLSTVAFAGTGLSELAMDVIDIETRPAKFSFFALIFASFIFFIFLLFYTKAETAIKKRELAAREVASPRIRAFLTSDGPISDPIFAGEALNALSRRIFRFIANRNTAAPVTLALTAEWGMGKSSAMRLLQKLLEKQGMPTIWFNAWHHQNEEHLFAALMEQIRKDAAPGPSRMEFFYPANLMVRARLMVQRFSDKPLRISLIAGFYIFLAIVCIKAFQSFNRPSIDILAAIGAIGATLLALQSLIQPFTKSPGVLLQSSRGLFSPTLFGDRLGFRDQFAQAFDEMCRALGPERRLTIFIDDLDRCQKQQAVDVLEAVNFLVSAGECYIVMGISERPVMNAVGLVFKELAAAHAIDARAAEQGAADRNRNGPAIDSESASREQTARAQLPPTVIESGMPTEPAAGAEPEVNEDTEEKRKALEDQRKFAANYLEKLINIKIEIPPFDNEALKNWLQKNGTPATVSRSSTSNSTVGPLGWSLRLVVLVIVVILAIFMARGIDLNQYPANSTVNNTQPKNVEITDSNQSGDGIASAEAVANTVPAADKQASGDSSSSEQRTSAEPERASAAASSNFMLGWMQWSNAPLATLILVVIAILAFIPGRSRELFGTVFSRPQALADLDEFTEAMELFLPLVLEHKGSPRAIKRFTNRMRFLTADLTQDEGSSVASLIAIAVAHEIGLAEGRQSNSDTILASLKKSLSEQDAGNKQVAWSSEAWNTYWNLNESASFSGRDPDTTIPPEAVAQ